MTLLNYYSSSIPLNYDPFELRTAMTGDNNDLIELYYSCAPFDYDIMLYEWHCTYFVT